MRPCSSAALRRGRKPRRLGGAIDHDGADGQSACSAPARSPAAVLAGEIEQRQPRAGKALSGEPREIVRIAVGRDHIGKSGSARSLGAAPADRQHRQRQQFAAPGMARERARAVGAGDEDRRPGRRAEIGVGTASMRSSGASTTSCPCARNAAAVRSLSGSGRVTSRRMVSPRRNPGPARPFSSPPASAPSFSASRTSPSRVASKRFAAVGLRRSCRESAAARPRWWRGRRSACGTSRRARRGRRARPRAR